MERMDTSNLKEIYVTGRPRSGTVWLNRLLADALNSPLEAPGDLADPALYFGPGRDGGYVIRKTHDEIKRGPTVFIQRDPRDVAISVWSFYKRTAPLFKVVQGMCEPHMNSYDRHIRMWLDDQKKADFYTRYELLHEHAEAQLLMIIQTLCDFTPDMGHLKEVVERQSFQHIRKTDVEGKYLHSMRKGVVGEWKEHFTSEIGQYMQHNMGALLIEQGYISDKHWWQELPDNTPQIEEK